VLIVAFLDVGQGDAIYVESPTGSQVLIDGGKSSAVLRELSKVMSPLDKTLDVVIASHPDLDHIGGLPNMFKRMDVGMYIESGVYDAGNDAQALRTSVEEEGLLPVLARPGSTLALGGGVYIEFLFPEGDAHLFEANTGSVVARVVYGRTAFMLTGDSPQSVENYLAQKYGASLMSNVLKAGHHGSKTSSGDAFLGVVSPEYAIISAACDNSYGHPHTEVLERLERFNIETLSTCDEGTIIFTSDGSSVQRK